VMKTKESKVCGNSREKKMRREIFCQKKKTEGGALLIGGGVPEGIFLGLSGLRGLGRGRCGKKLHLLCKGVKRKEGHDCKGGAECYTRGAMALRDSGKHREGKVSS